MPLISSKTLGAFASAPLKKPCKVSSPILLNTPDGECISNASLALSIISPITPTVGSTTSTLSRPLTKPSPVSLPIFSNSPGATDSALTAASYATPAPLRQTSAISFHSASDCSKNSCKYLAPCGPKSTKYCTNPSSMPNLPARSKAS